MVAFCAIWLVGAGATEGLLLGVGPPVAIVILSCQIVTHNRTKLALTRTHYSQAAQQSFTPGQRVRKTTGHGNSWSENGSHLGHRKGYAIVHWDNQERPTPRVSFEILTRAG